VCRPWRNPSIHQVNCFVALAIISLHTSRSLAALNMTVTFSTFNHDVRPSNIFSRGLPLLRLPSSIPVVMSYPIFSRLITCPKIPYPIYERPLCVRLLQNLLICFLCRPRNSKHSAEKPHFYGFQFLLNLLVYSPH